MVDFETCMAALPAICGAPKDDVPIDHLCFRPDYGKRSFPDQLNLTVAGGITGERWAKDAWLKRPDGSADPRIQVSILQKQVLDLVWTDRETMVHPGDSIIADMDLSEANLPVGSYLSIGSAILQVSDEFNTGCVKWHRAYGNESLRWINVAEHKPLRLRGILCRIVQDGVVEKTDRIRKHAG